ncbi:hypothetical protein PAN31108_04652 [Pandoraea anhela]|uniref:Phosphodiester glycosidase domain-containing protein n=2 Tax=Pandoraea anhela TaxID=2508295 RepID=A0A5E4YMV0_9BURK|nr:hypothetical protein PAN31108_04652 [Pandoraea anhela]
MDVQLSGLPARQIARAKATLEGARVRQQVRVQSVAPGIVKTTIRPPKPDSSPASSAHTPLSRIQGLMKPTSEYTRVTVAGGAGQTRVIGTTDGALPARPEVLAQHTPVPTAIVNGGYFIHKPGMLDDQGKSIDKIGVTIGPTSHRSDHQPISEIWKPYYGQVKINDETALCSGPLLAQNGEQEAVPFTDNKFLYRPDGKHENELNKLGGAMTPCGDPIERSAISVNMSAAGDRGDVVMHALTAGGSRTNGAKMADWQKLTKIGADSAQGHAHFSGTGGNASTLALDGGGSTYVGVRNADGVTTLAHGRGGISGDGIRPTPNIIVSTPSLGAQPGVPADANAGRIAIAQALQGN